MRTLLVLAGGRPKGNSYNLCNYLKEKLEGEDISFDFLDMGKQDYTPCNMCCACLDSRVCRIEDSLSKYVKDFSEYTNVIFITPITYFQAHVFFKHFLDRLFCCKNEDWDNKNIYLIVVSGSKHKSGADLVQEALQRLADYHNCFLKRVHHKVTYDDVLPLDNEDITCIENIVESIKEELKDGNETQKEVRGS